MMQSKQIEKPLYVLVEDDQEINRDVLGMILEDDYQVIYAEDDLIYKSMKLEVTESACINNADRLIDVITCLREKGFEIEMDDFGSDYSSLNMLFVHDYRYSEAGHEVCAEH